MTRPSDRYAALVESGTLKQDPAQVAGLAVLDETYQVFMTPARRRWWQRGRRWLAAAPSIYLHGPVGRGKSLIMDLFVEAIADAGKGERVHFHAFMLGVHQRIHSLQHSGHRGDPMPTLAAEIATRTPLLCFDEFVVNNIADAMILGRLFDALWGQGITIVATSNFAPVDLYKDGLHRARFLPFIEMIQQRMKVQAVAGAEDYRILQSRLADVFFAPFTMPSRVAFEDAYKRLSLEKIGGPQTLQIGTRSLSLPWVGAGIAMAKFADLCEKPLGAADYLGLTRAFHGLALDEVPQLNADRRNEASRFRVLIDTLYEAGTLLLLRSAVPAAQLYVDTKNVENRRTLSRLSEMQGQTYVNRALARLDQAAHGS